MRFVRFAIFAVFGVVVAGFLVDAVTTPPPPVWTVRGAHSAGDRTVPGGVRHYVTCVLGADGPLRVDEVTPQVQDDIVDRLIDGGTSIPCPIP